MVHINWRRASRFSVITLAILVVAIILLVQHHTASNTSQAPAQNTTGANTAPTASTSSQSMQRTDLKKVAPAFQLFDQDGRSISLAQFKGKSVVLTFFSTACSSNCSQTVNAVNASLHQLNGAANNIVVLTISTDASKDTSTAARNFLAVHHLPVSWHYLVGQQAQLDSILSNYSGQATAQNAVYLIDKQGNERTILSGEIMPEPLRAELQQLLSE